MALADVARAYYAAQSALAAAVRLAVRALWGEVDVVDLSGSWASRRLGDRLFVAISSGQLAAAGQAPAYVARALVEQRAASSPLGVLLPQAMAGVASDGRDLETLVYEPVIRVKEAIGRGAAPARAMQVGGSSLETIATTQVADAGRAAAAVAMAVEPAVTGWVRMLVPPSCGRCVVLAGRRYRTAEIGGFDRHERCDCVSCPAVEDAADDIRTDPADYFRSLAPADQARYFTVAGAEAIRSGADIGQVVNARRGASGLSQPGRLTDAEQRMLRGGRDRGQLQRVDVYGRQLAITSEGVTVRGLAGQRLARTGGTEKRPGARNRSAKTPRLMPESVLEAAGDDREERTRLLRRFGYIAG